MRARNRFPSSGLLLPVSKWKKVKNLTFRRPSHCDGFRRRQMMIFPILCQSQIKNQLCCAPPLKHVRASPLARPVNIVSTSRGQENMTRQSMAWFTWPLVLLVPLLSTPAGQVDALRFATPMLRSEGREELQQQEVCA